MAVRLGVGMRALTPRHPPSHPHHTPTAPPPHPHRTLTDHITRALNFSYTRGASDATIKSFFSVVIKEKMRGCVMLCFDLI